MIADSPKLDVAARIVCDSPFAAGLARLTGCVIDYIPRQHWLEDLPRYVAALAPRLVVVDTFPYGIRGEWAAYKGRLAIMARRLHLDAYARAVTLPLESPLPGTECFITAEPLNDAYQELIKRWGTKSVTLPGRVRLPVDSISAPPVPVALAEMVDVGTLWLVVHSGPPDEVQRLIEVAKAAMGDADEPLAVISPWTPSSLDIAQFEYFPATSLFSRSRRVVTGAGYNLMAEMAPFPEKHIVIPFPRKFDDQAGRIEWPLVSKCAGNDSRPIEHDGGPMAARHIASML